jgi:hypothetical protein
MARLEESQVFLARGISVARYREFVAAEDRAAIARFVQTRFKERYLRPITTPGKHGFTMMAVACLMIETLESFAHGWRDTKRRSEEAFVKFFKRHRPFAVFHPIARGFWRDIRCGLLHQGEARGGWRIRRSGPLLEQASKVINATRFVSALAGTLDEYAQALQLADWNSFVWRNCRSKMDAICENALGS